MRPSQPTSTAAQATSPTRRYVDAFFDDASECLLIWRETCDGLQSVPLYMQPRIGWESLHAIVARLQDGARRVDFFDLAQFIQTMIEPIAMIRDGLLPPSKLVLDTLSQTQTVVENWIHNLSKDQFYTPAGELVRFAAETAAQVMLPPLNQTPIKQGTAAENEAEVKGHSQQEFQSELASLKEVTEKQRQSLVVLSNAVAKLGEISDHPGELLSRQPSQAKLGLSTGSGGAGIDRETLAQIRGKIVKRHLPTAYVVFRLGENLLATRAADIAPINLKDAGRRKLQLTLSDFAPNEIPSSLEISSLEGFFNISDEQIDQNIVMQGSIPRQWLRGIIRWNGDTVSLVDIKGYLKDVAQREDLTG